MPPLRSLIEAGLTPQTVIIPAASTSAAAPPRRLRPPAPVSTDLPMVDPYLEQNCVHLAWAHDLPVYEVGSLTAAHSLDLLAAFEPDVIIVACFSLLLPSAVLSLPRYGCLNLHPSLLPAYRGPTPFFWLARQEERQGGVTLHYLDEGLDTGDIVAQSVLDWPEDLSGIEFEQRCAVEGGRLAAEALRQLDAGQALPRQPQPPEKSSYFSAPTAEDFVIPTHWSAQRAFSFLRRAEGWPLIIILDGKHIFIRIAIDYEPEQRLPAAHLFNNNELWVQFNPGVVRMRIAK
ncbi:MAG TPA: formyltransferase family protein [Anaerolineae bacterium]